MEIGDYWRELSATDKHALASRASTSYLYLAQIAGGHRKAGHKFARRLAELTGLPLSSIRPDIWANGE